MSTSQVSYTEYTVRVPQTTKKKYHIMRYNAEHGNDFFKNWTQCRMERENLRTNRADEELPKFGAGSEFGREQREEARRKRYGINIKRDKSENQPWRLTIGGKGGKKFRGVREGGVAENAAWFVFMQGKDGSFEAYPIDEWYKFQTVSKYKALSAEEAEKEFERRDKIRNYFQVMYEKKLRKDQNENDDDELKSAGKKKKKNLVLSEMDDWDVSGGELDGDGFDEDDDDDDRPKKKKRGSKKKQGGKKVSKVDDDSEDNSCMEESDDFDEGAEQDYISGDSSDSDHMNEEVVGKELAGVEEGEALKNLLASDESSDEEKKDEENKEEKKEEAEEESGEKKKKKKKKKDRKHEKATEKTPSSSGDEAKKGAEEDGEKKKTVTEIKRKAKSMPSELELHTAKKSKLESPNIASASSTSSNASGGSDTGVNEDSIRRYLMRKPMTTTELLQKFKSKKTGLSSEQLVQSVAQILKRVNPVKQMVQGKMYLSIKN